MRSKERVRTPILGQLVGRLVAVHDKVLEQARAQRSAHILRKMLLRERGARRGARREESAHNDQPLCSEGGELGLRGGGHGTRQGASAARDRVQRGGGARLGV